MVGISSQMMAISIVEEVFDVYKRKIRVQLLIGKWRIDIEHKSSGENLWLWHSLDS